MLTDTMTYPYAFTTSTDYSKPHIVASGTKTLCGIEVRHRAGVTFWAGYQIPALAAHSRICKRCMGRYGKA